MNKEKILLFTLAAINFAHIMDFMIMMPLGPQLMRIFDITPQQFGLLVSSYNISAAVVGFLGASFMDAFDRKSILLTCFVGFVLGTLACAISPTYPILLVSRIGAGAFGGILSALVLSIVGDTIPEERRGAAMGIIMAAFSLASVAGVPFGLYLANQFDWHAPFFFLAGMGVPITGVIWLVVPAMKGHLQQGVRLVNPFGVLGSIVKDKGQRTALMLTSVLMLGHFSVIPYLSPYMVSNVGLAESEITYIYLVGGLLTIFSAPLVGKLADYKGKAWVFTLFSLLAMIPLMLITHMSVLALPLVLAVTGFFFITTSGRFIPSTALVTSAVAAQKRGRFMSINSCVQQLSAAIAAAVAGMVLATGPNNELQHYNLVGYGAAFFSILCIFIAWRLRPVAEQPVSEIKEVPAEV
jgi:predicted MFS family arabinose efflux permease